jgi:hypothetical protein
MTHTDVSGTTGTLNNGVTLETSPAPYCFVLTDRIEVWCLQVVLSCVVLCCVVLCLFADDREKLEFVVVGKSQYDLQPKLYIVLFV